MFEARNGETAQRPQHPRQKANWLSFITFWYIIPIFRKGKQRELGGQDITQPLEAHKSSKLGKVLAERWSKAIRRGKELKIRTSLTKVLLKMFWKEIVVEGTVLLIIQVPIRLCQPLFLSLLLRYFSFDNENSKEPPRHPMYLMRLLNFWEKQSPIQSDEAYLFASGVFFCSLANVMAQHPCMLEIMHLGMKLRVACCSLLYRKTLRLDMASLGVGAVVNLMSNDVSRFDTMVIPMHYVWLGPFQMIFCMVLMCKEVGLAAVIGICTILAVIPLQAWFGSRTSKFRLKTARRSDQRVRQMNEILQGMQVIKMYTWEDAFAQQIRHLRSSEMETIGSTCFIRGTIMSFVMFTSRLAVFVTILVMVYSSQPITAEKIFVIMSFYQILKHTMTLLFPNAITQIAEVKVTLGRISKFMKLPECKTGDPSVLDPNWSSSQPVKPTGEPGIILRNVSAKTGRVLCLENVSLTISNKSLTAVIGQIGSGKSTLFNLILGEVQPNVGTVDVSGSVSFASQEPWLFDGTVRQNILFGCEYRSDRYLEVVKVCALLRDFQMLPLGDLTTVGEKGCSLSGGQRARIGLARAVYKQADVYLLDDPLSALDSDVARHIFDSCLCKFLADKIVILVTHQIQFLSEVDHVILMDNGKILAEGSYRDLHNSSLNFAAIFKSSSSLDSEESVSSRSSIKIEQVITDLKLKGHRSLTVIDKEGERYKPRVDAETQTPAIVNWDNHKEYFRAGGNWFVIFGVLVLFFGAEAFASGGDYFVAAWVDMGEKRLKNHSPDTGLSNFVSDWFTEIYSVLIIATMATALIRSLVFFIVCVRASLNLHDRMFRSVINAPMSFFNKNASGRVLNRFSKDLGTVDELLPIAMLDCYQTLLNLLGAVCLVISTNFYFVIPSVLICVVFYILKSYYLKTSRSVKKLEGTFRSPVFSHVNATIHGLVTIRSIGAEKILTEEFDQLQDDHSGAWFVLIATARAFGYWLDVVCALYTGFICYFFLFFATSGSSVGLAITATIGLTGFFQWGMKQSAEVQNQMIAVERISKYVRMDQEVDLESETGKKPPPEWPTEGRVEFQNVVLRYNPYDTPVLKSLSFLINPQEKIGIVGRTGAGKSSLISALFRLAHFQGAIVVDGINTTEIALRDLRSKISIIPQDPVLFSGTLRYNMDPFENFNDASIVQALQTVENKFALRAGAECLKFHVSERGVNISVGERQLICLARAILRNNRILVLDEATANIDPHTDNSIQRTIRKNFAYCTILTIAHRLNTIMDSDRVLVIEEGKIAEFDHPYILLKNAQGIFSQMVGKTGKVMSGTLTEIAKKNYKRKEHLK